MSKVEKRGAFAQNDSGNKEKGSYILLVRIAEEEIMTVGHLAAISFPAGDYAYVGSAMRGFKARLSHHRRQNKKPHWHIDYLRQRAAISNIILCESKERMECTIARALSRRFNSVPGFGASDCQCRSHLFFSAEAIKPAIMTILHSLGLTPRLAGEAASGNKL